MKQSNNIFSYCNRGVSFLLLCSALSISHAKADDKKTVEAPQSDPKAYALMTEADKRDLGWEDTAAKMQMIIRRSDGREVIREVKTQTMEGDDGRDKSLLFFYKPLDVNGTVFLTHSYPLDPDHQWIYLPSQNRVKRISSKRQTGRFMGSEFTFEDMAGFSLDKNTYQYLGETECGEPLQACHIIETRSKDRYSGYEKSISYIDQVELRSWKSEFYSKRTGKLSKTLEVKAYQLYLDKYWRPDELSMRNENTGATTVLKWSDQQFRIGLEEKEFRKSALERRQ